MVERHAAIYRGTFLQHGSQFDYAAGKSDCLIVMSRAHAKKIRKIFFLRVCVCVAETYAHFGGLVTSKVDGRALVF